MIKRTLQLPKNHSFFLFGPRQTGKSTLLKATFAPATTLYYDLLRASEYLRLSRNPSLFREEVLSRHQKYTHVVVDEIQRIPELLNEIHSLLETPHPAYFCLSGSSARKLKRTHANLLAGRAWTFHLYPLTHLELGDRFTLKKALKLGTLPSVYLCDEEDDALRTLHSYVETYLKEEIEMEALVRNLGSFLRFLTLAGDGNGNVINYSNIARDAGVSYKAVKEYFQILEDTLVGLILLPYSKTTRKRLAKHPKFYFFDVGVQRAVSGKTALELEPGTSEFGRGFEHFMITEIVRLAGYRERNFRFSFYQSSGYAEVDLIVETPRGKTYAVELKANENPNPSALKGLKSFSEVCPKAILLCGCLALRRRRVNGISILPWREIFEVLELK